MSGSSKAGRGAGRGMARRIDNPPPPPLGRGMAMQPLRRQSGGGVGGSGSSLGKGRMGSLGGGRESSSGGGGMAVSASQSQEESFQLLQQQEGLRPFAMAIRLTPELLSDLKRVESEGGACLMKFGVTPAGHVIKIGDEEFKFSSAREPGELCDIFEEQRRGEDGNGILREAGSVWRKLSVLRTLNASEKDRVKNRSKEAEQKQKSRKAIILDPTHSMVNNQNPGSGDVNGRRAPIKMKKEPPKKKLKVTTSSPAPIPVPVSAPAPKPKPVASTASVIASAKAAKAASVASPELPPPVRALVTPPNLKASAEEGPGSVTNKSCNIVQKDTTPSPATTTPDVAPPAKPGGVVSASELRNCLITLLTDNPKGMTIKAVEKALGEATPHVKPERKTIEKAIKAIASYHAPGKYMLKEGVSFAKTSPNSGSSPENAVADSPPLVDSPAPDMAIDGLSHEPVIDGFHPSESGLLGDKPGAIYSVATGKTSSIVQKSNESAMSRAIRKANESYQKSQPQSSDQFKPSPATPSQRLESATAKEHEAGGGGEQISIGGDESSDIEIIEGESQLDMNVDIGVESQKGGGESAPSSPKEEARATNSGGSDSSSSSGSSDSDSDSSDSGDSHSATSGSGSDSDSDGSSSSGSEDENMDEDVEIMSDEEEGDAPHQKSKGKDKKQASRQSKEAKRAKLKPPEKLLPAHDSEEVDIGGDEVGHPGVDLDEQATVVVENLDVNDDIEVDVISVGGGGSPHEDDSVSPTVSYRQAGDGRKEGALSEVTQLLPIASKQQDATVKNTLEIEGSQSHLEKKGVGTGPHDSTPADKKEHRDLPQRTTGRGNTSGQLREEPAKAGENSLPEKETSAGKAAEVEKSKAVTLKGRSNGLVNNRMAKNSTVNINNKIAVKESPVHINNRLAAKESPAQSASPLRPETGAKSLLGSPSLRKDATETSPRPSKESVAKRRGNPDFRKSFSKEAEPAAKTAKELESDELVDKIVEAPTRPWPRPSKNADLANRAVKQSDPSQSLDGDTVPDSGAKVLRDNEATGPIGRDTEAEILPSATRPLRDGVWRHNPEAGLLGKPGKNVEYLGRPQSRDMESNLYGNRQLKNMRRPNIEPEATRRIEPGNESDSWGKPSKEVDGALRSGNDSEVMINRLREGRKELTRQEGPKGSFIGNVSRQNGKKGRDSPDLESGELRESTSSEQWDNRGRDGARMDQFKNREAVEAVANSKPLPNKFQSSPARDKVRSSSKNAGDLRKPSPGTTIGELRKPSPIKSVGDFRKPSPGKAAGDLRKPSPVKTVGELRKPSPGKAAGDLRKPSPATSNAQKLVQAQKEVQKSDQIVARDGNRVVSGSGKHPSSSQVDDRIEVGSGRSIRAAHSDAFERPTEPRGVKRLLEDGNNHENSRLYKKPSIAPAAPTSSLNRGNSDSGPASKAEKKQVSPDVVSKSQSVELGRGGSSDGTSNLAGPSGKAPSGENTRKQRPFAKGQKVSARDSLDPPRPRDGNTKTGVNLSGPGGETRLPMDPMLSNGKQLKSSSSPEEVTGKEYFAKYEKDAPELRGPIRTYEEAEMYKKEYQSKYAVYRQIYADLERNKGQFSTFKKEMELARSYPDKMQQIGIKVRKEFQATRKENRRMQKTFDILHEELQAIKQHLKNFAEKAGQG